MVLLIETVKYCLSKHCCVIIVVTLLKCCMLDPVYTVSSENDHARATLEAHTCTEKLVSVEHILCFL